MAESRRLKRKTWLTAIVATAGIAGPTFGTITPVGGELAVSLVGAYATGPAVAVAPSGAFTVVWQQYTDASAEWDVYRRRFDPGGAALDPSPVRVNTTTVGCQVAPAIASDGVGNFIVAWQSDDRVMFRRYAADGSALDATDRTVDAGAPGIQRNAAVAASTSTGEFLIAWQGRGAAGDTSSWGVYATAFDGGGAPAGSPSLVNVVTTGAQHSPAAVYSLGSPSVFFVVWQSHGQDGSGAGLYWRRLSLSGGPLGAADELVGTTTAGSQRKPQVASDASGNVVVLWESQGIDGQTTLVARRLRSSGTSIAGEVAISTTSTPIAGSVASALGGDFLAAWARTAADGELDVLRRAFDHHTMAFEPEQGTVSTAARQEAVAAAAGGPWQVVIAWASTAAGQPPAVVAQRLEISALDFFTVTPCRMVDTRLPAGPLGGPQLQAGVTRTFVLTSNNPATCGIPNTARVLSINVTAVPIGASGFIRLSVGDAPQPSVSTINYNAIDVRANNAILLLSRDGIGSLVAFASTNVHLVVDVNGYFE